MKPTILKLKQHILIALGYFFIAAFLGVVLRFFRVLDIPVNYKFIVHTHSHIALLGWVYLALTTLLYRLYLSNQNLDKRYSRIFWFTQMTLAGMLCSFPFQGYALLSITFSTLFLFASYWFACFFVTNTPKKIKNTYSYTCFLIALGYLLLSSIGPWVLGIVMNTLGPTSVWYRIAIYFYLHFQYNGWMIMGLLGAFFFLLESSEIVLGKKQFERFIWGFNIGIVFTFLLSVLWVNPPVYVNYLAGFGAVLQMAAFGYLFRGFLKLKITYRGLFSNVQLSMITFLVGLLIFKMSLQLLSAVPYFATLAATVLDFTIAYLHWTFLGVVTIGLFLFADIFGLIRISERSFYVYIIGFLPTEFLIFYKGFGVWQNKPIIDNYDIILAIVSIFIPIALLLILKDNIKGVYMK
ncbi:hypothetical protein [uncultured Maribacter sp.]|uniref:hypothetical protein n=1 Tax=uncultured Maribacter sp. TaxID=431308 RepID=UPI002627CAF3|nr:hypothetical protein [uncultured Maribacter sp.]